MIVCDIVVDHSSVTLAISWQLYFNVHIGCDSTLMLDCQCGVQMSCVADTILQSKHNSHGTCWQGEGYSSIKWNNRCTHIDQGTANKHHRIKDCNPLLLISQQTISGYSATQNSVLLTQLSNHPLHMYPYMCYLHSWWSQPLRDKKLRFSFCESRNDYIRTMQGSTVFDIKILSARMTSPGIKLSWEAHFHTQKRNVVFHSSVVLLCLDS